MPPTSRRRSIAVVAVAYVAAIGAALVAGGSVESSNPLLVALWADIAGTVAIFAFSLVLRNSSLYDPYWSVVPPVVVLYWCMRPEVVGVNPFRLVFVVALVSLWGARLTWNWLRGWEGLHHEDWRYVMIQGKTGAAYWPASFLGIHLFPTLIVFLGLLPAYVAVAAASEPFGPLDLVAIAVTLGAIALEARADKQLKRFRESDPAPGDFLKTGTWKWSRHPNYLGEMGFWWGLWLFALAANPAWWWTGIGAVAITVMFRFASLPMIENRMLERRPAYAEHAERSSLVLPIPRRSES
jgi:steroid 5-alpha reductase family enzyme